jgi:hypothetical protein
LKDFIQQCKVTDLQIYYNRPAELDALKYTDFLKKYNTSSKLPKYYKDCPNTLNNISINQHYFKVYMDPDQSICYVYQPVRQVKRCMCIENLYVSSGDIFYLRLILLNRKAHSDKDVLTYIPVCGGGKPIICTRYQQSAIVHDYVDSVADVCATYHVMCTNGMGAQCRSYFVVLSLHGYATHVIFDDYERSHFMFMDYITYQGVAQVVAKQMMLQDLEHCFSKSHSPLEKLGFPTPDKVPTELEEAISLSVSPDILARQGQLLDSLNKTIQTIRGSSRLMKASWNQL